jgi:hypothetical protein
MKLFHHSPPFLCKIASFERKRLLFIGMTIPDKKV